MSRDQKLFTAEESEIVTRLWEEGELSAAGIAKALGTGRSRSSIMSFVRRRGLSKRFPREPNVHPVKAKKIRTPRSIGRIKLLPNIGPPRAYHVSPPPDKTEYAVTGMIMPDTGFCKMHYGSDDIKNGGFWCGKPAVEDNGHVSYCRECADRIRIRGSGRRPKLKLTDAL